MNGKRGGILSRLLGDHGFWKDGPVTRDAALERIEKLAGDMEWGCKLGVFMLAFGLIAAAYLSFAVTIPGLEGAAPHVIMEDGSFGGVLLVNEGNGIRLTLLSEDGETILSSLFSLIVWIAAAWRASRFFQGIVETGRPFELARARDLKSIASAMTRWSAALFLVDFAFARVLLAVVPGGEAVGFGIRPSFPLAFLIFGGMLLVIARVWEYGCILQEQDDALL